MLFGRNKTSILILHGFFVLCRIPVYRVLFRGQGKPFRFSPSPALQDRSPPRGESPGEHVQNHRLTSSLLAGGHGNHAVYRFALVKHGFGVIGIARVGFAEIHVVQHKAEILGNVFARQTVFSLFKQPPFMAQVVTFMFISSAITAV